MKSKIRLLFQLIILAVIIRVIIVGWDVEAFCPLGGILSFGTQLYQNTMACSMSEVAIFMALALVVGILIIGKLFCSYICPIGLITEWFGKLGKKLHLHFLLPKVVDRFFRIFKYALLFFVLYYTVTSSELFCRKFEPYFGMATGFKHDVVLWWSLTAVALTILGSIFIKQFWCKYLCPLGAISNIFANIYLLIIPFGVFFIVRSFDPGFSLAWLFGLLALLSYAWEAGVFKFIPLPFMKVTVDQDQCTQCGNCMEACPYGIRVFEYKKVEHPDCMMCSDCIYACDLDDVIGISKSRKTLWVPPVLVIALPLLGFILSSHFEFATLEMRWGNFDTSKHIAQYKQSGISDIKCYGTSFALYKRLKDKKGIYGLNTYARTHTAVVFYDSTEIDEEGVKADIFNPRRYKTRNFIEYKPDSLAVWRVGIENFFDMNDHMNLIRILRNNPHIFGLESRFGEPVQVTMFFCSDSTSPPEIRKSIDETKRIETTIRGKERVYEMDFTCENGGRVLGKVSRAFYEERMFGPYSQCFNGFEKRDLGDLSIYEIGMPEAGNFMMRRMFPYLVSHISEDSSIVCFKTTFIKDRPAAHIYFDPAGMDTATIFHLLEADTLRYFRKDDTKGAIKNMFTFEYPSTLYKASDFVDPVGEAKRRKLGPE